MNNKKKTQLSRRNFVSGLGAMAGMSMLSNQSKAVGDIGSPHIRKRTQPNVLLIMSDQERSYTTLPSELDLPAHDYLMTHGVGFDNYYVNTSPCSPSRSVIYSGQHTMKTGVSSNLHTPPFAELESNVKTLGHYLKEQGYKTAYKGKWHLTTVEDAPDLMYGKYPSQTSALKAFGFDEFNLTGDVHGSVWSGRKMDNIIASEACEWLRNLNPKDEQPWCLAVNFVNPHDIMFYSTGSEQSNSRLGSAFMAPLKGKPSHPLYKTDWSHIGLPDSFNDDLADKPWAHNAFKQLLDDIYGKISPQNETAWLDQQSYYFNCLRDVSRQADQVIQQLAAVGELDNTIIIYTSDHGEMAGAHGLRQKGPTVYKENCNVPLIIKHPDIKHAHQNTQLASALDLVPTVLEMVGMDSKAIHDRYPELAGVSVAGALSKNKTQRDELGHLFAYSVMLYSDPSTTRSFISNEITVSPLNLLLNNFKQGKILPDLSNKALHRGVYDGRYKFTRYYAADSHHIPESLDQLKQHNELELYDTLNDPNEMTNLAAIESPNWKLIDRLNQQLNGLIKKEIGQDDGGDLMGPKFMYQL